MARKPAKVCRTPGCPNTTTDRTGFCLTCKKRRNKEYDKRRPSSSRRGFGGDWQRVRMAKLADTPLCERCQAEDRLTAAELVHHKDGDHLNNEWDNLESLCRTHHERHHVKERFAQDKPEQKEDDYVPTL